MKRRNAVALDVGHRGVAAHAHDTAGLHRTRGKRRDHCAVTDEHYAATGFVGDHHGAVARHDRVVRLTVDILDH